MLETKQRDPRMRYVRVPELGPAPAEEPFDLTFLLPRELTLGVVAGAHHPCLHRCLLRIEHYGRRDYRVLIKAPSRQLAFEQARRYLRVAAKGHIAQGSALRITAALVTPSRICSGSDGWTIIVGADVAFAPTTIPPDLPSVS